MPEAQDIVGVAFLGGSAVLMARLRNVAAELLLPEHVSAAEYTAYLLDENTGERTAVAVHTAVEIAPADILYDELQEGGLWDVDATGYNFRHELDVSEGSGSGGGGVLFNLVNRHYLIEFRLTPTAGQVILVRFRIHAI